MKPKLIQNKHAWGHTKAFDHDVQAGNALVARVIAPKYKNAAVVAVTDTIGNTWIPSEHRVTQLVELNAFFLEPDPLSYYDEWFWTATSRESGPDTVDVAIEGTIEIGLQIGEFTVVNESKKQTLI